ncbi:MAG: amidohydrolase [Deltaproteobacteria bacterium HGW-Deltaproteobacteria-9]|nr:MAG: amidohydrolase [Deltaproteobacteria bacterium HGW-Deltaproteobacteria-9]
MQDLTITLIQTELFWEDIPANIAMFDKKIDSISAKTDVIILPETFSTGFTMNAGKVAEPMNGSAVSWITKKARQRKAHILGSVIIEEDKKYFNRLILAKPDGALAAYDKKHLFRMAGEHEVFSPGNSHLTVEVRDWKLRFFICYDLRFPVWCRNINNQYDVAVYIANWPGRRAPHWKLLLPARAVENQSYVIGVNRVGRDGNGLAYSGDSSVIDPLGNILFQKADISCIHTETLNYDRVREYRETFAAWQDADGDAVLFPGSR